MVVVGAVLCHCRMMQVYKAEKYKGHTSNPADVGVVYQRGRYFFAKVGSM